MLVNVCIPRVEARDLRPEVPLEQSLVITSGHKASFLMLEVRACAGRRTARAINWHDASAAHVMEL